MTVAIIDYGMGNLGSLRRALEECGGHVITAQTPADAEPADRWVLPGVGAFSDGMAHLRERGWVEAIQQSVHEKKRPLLGICLGMQLLSDKGYEGGENQGLQLIGGDVVRLKPPTPETRIPHVGWNEVHMSVSSPLFNAIADGTDFYFVHSYHFQVKDTTSLLAETPYCDRFVSVVGQGLVYGVQFHPEKSQRPGMQLLRNFLALN